MTTPNDLPMIQLRNESWVASAAPSDLRRALTIMIKRQDAESLDTITSPVCAERVETMTKTIKHELEAELAQMNAEKLAEQQRCFRLGRSGKSTWFNYLSDWQTRKSVINRQRSFTERILVQCRMNAASAKITATYRSESQERAVKALCTAIYNHQRATSDARPADEALWSALDLVEIAHGQRGYITGRELLEDIGATYGVIS